MKKLRIFVLLALLFGMASCDYSALPPPSVPSGLVVTFEPIPTAEPTAPATAAPTPDDGIPAVADVPVVNDFTIDDIIFLGDSTTYGMKAYGVLSGGTSTDQVWTPKSGTLTLDHQSYATIVYPPDGTEITIRDAAEKSAPEVIVITLGVNGVSFMGKDTFKAEYSDLIMGISKASPDTIIILQSIFPVASNYEYLKSINNEKIIAANSWIEEIADSFKLTFVDAYPKLIGEDGWLPQNLQNGDGLHLTEAGFAIVINNLKETLAIQ
ncbi:MAG: SGNH/GDSL hydrolase family protein [Oscillospiraceae bacterium]|jgi:lysophospholipase L1-like esterase|nr:SGNH/GDSL hydrolase family protein [Oscillospiraceae bacterium]